MVETVLKSIVPPPSLKRLVSSNSPFPYPDRDEFPEFSALQQAELFRKTREREFTGRLFLSDRQGVESVLYFYLGRLVYATGGSHPVRRWQRSLTVYCPHILQDPETFRQGLMSVVETDSPISWEYQVLVSWAKQRKITLEQLTGIIRSHIEEILFDLTRAGRVSWRGEAERMDGFVPLTVISAEAAIANSWKQWQDWQNAKLADRSPDRAPIVRDFSELAERVAPSTFEIFRKNFTGQYSLRDLSVHLDQDLIALTRSLLMYVQLGLIELVSIDDFPAPIDILPPALSREPRALMIAYGDEDPRVCQRMAEMIASSGHRYLTVRDGLQAISVFVEREPDLICLGSRLLYTDGYTICKALRQLSAFQKTPILIFSDRVGLSDRIRAKISGASEIVERSPSLGKFQQLLGRYC
ncbi:DUF4388 domain-containing protein [Pannus brasiliensis CCIBt3594]|uniref:Protein PatA n=1 Tax=Pannus brasiliensis CCIBt3594 TaxID=1427578 RepID=A0AAW9QFL2_9CHRO